MIESVTDNIYPVGMQVHAKVNPSLPLIINKYYQRIYYCTRADGKENDYKAYFERELIEPRNFNNRTNQ